MTTVVECVERATLWGYDLGVLIALPAILMIAVVAIVIAANAHR